MNVPLDFRDMLVLSCNVQLSLHISQIGAQGFKFTGSMTYSDPESALLVEFDDTHKCFPYHRSLLQREALCHPEP
jgi:hypothetical protein